MKVCIISYYGLRDGLLSAANGLKKRNNDIIDYPLLYEAQNRENYVEHFIEFIKSNAVNIALWWHIGVEFEKMEVMVNGTKHCKHIYFNWDDPYNWGPCDMARKSQLLDAAFLCSADKLKDYLDNGCKQSVWLLPGYDEKINNILQDDNLGNNYDCDISFICTNLYINYNDFPEQEINRKKLIDEIYKGHVDNKYIFHIYGPEFLREHYPDSYRGFISYDNQNLLFNKSKINLCTHVNNKYKYLNERCVMVAGSGGLLLVDNMKGLDEVFSSKSYVIIKNIADIQTQICKILDNYDDYIDMRLNLKKDSEMYTWDKWAETVQNEFISKLKM